MTRSRPNLDADFGPVFATLVAQAWVATLAWLDLKPEVWSIHANWPVVLLWLSVLAVWVRFRAGHCWWQSAAMGFALVAATLMGCLVEASG